MKKILIVHRYYYPDTPAYAVMLKKIGENLAKKGHLVDVLTSYPSYYGSSIINVKKKESINNVNVFRAKLLPEKNRNFTVRTINSILFAFIVFFKILFRKKYDIITVATTPPIIMATVIRIVSVFKKNKYIYHCQDIYPEIAYYNNNIKSERVFNFLKKIDKKNNEKATKVVVLSKDMKNTLVKERNINENRIEIINNFIRTDVNSKSLFDYSNYNILKDDFIIVFCGNLGKLQNLDSLISLAKSLEDYKKIKIVFIGSGVEEKRLKKESGNLLNKKIFFLGYLKSDIAINALKQSNIGVVSISDQTYKTAYPSKTMTYLNAGIPIAAIINETSELANFISDNNIGVNIKPNNLDDFKIKILKLYHKNELKNNLEIQKIAQQEFGEKIILQKWEELIEKV